MEAKGSVGFWQPPEHDGKSSDQAEQQQHNGPRNTDLAAGKRPLAGSLHLGINPPIPEVIGDTARTADGQAADDDGRQQGEAGGSLALQEETPAGGDQQDQASAGLVPAQ